jgi:hypothetical protein
MAAVTYLTSKDGNTGLSSKDVSNYALLNTSLSSVSANVGSTSKAPVTNVGLTSRDV